MGVVLLRSTFGCFFVGRHLQAVCFAGQGGLIVNISYRFTVSSLGWGGSELAWRFERKWENIGIVILVALKATNMVNITWYVYLRNPHLEKKPKRHMAWYDTKMLLWYHLGWDPLGSRILWQMVIARWWVFGSLAATFHLLFADCNSNNLWNIHVGRIQKFNFMLNLSGFIER